MRWKVTATFFEAGKGSIDADRLREKFTTQIRWFTDMIDELRLNRYTLLDKMSV